MHPTFSVEAALDTIGCNETVLPVDERARHYAASLAESHSWAERLGEPSVELVDETTNAVCERFGELRFFNAG
jgi:hypothetical protein